MLQRRLNLEQIVEAIFPRLVERIRRRREGPEVSSDSLQTHVWGSPPETFYVTSTATKFHRRDCKSIEGRELTSITRAQAEERNISPCRMCRA